MDGVLRTDSYKRKNWDPHHLTGAKSDSADRMDNLYKDSKPKSGTKPEDLIKFLYPTNENAPISDVIAKATKELLTNNNENAYKFAALQREYPELDRVLNELVEARLSLLNSDEPWTTDKDYGWGIRDINTLTLDEKYQPFIQDITLEIDDEGGQNIKILWSDKFPTGTPEGDAIQEEISNHIQKGYEAPIFYPMTKEMAETQGYGWVPSTDEYINGLYSTDPAFSKYADKEVLYDNLRTRLKDKLNNDTEGKYATASERFESNPNQFILPDKVAKGVFSAVAPFSAGAKYDDELSYKTSTGERVARGVADAALGVASFALPLGFARLGLNKAGGKLVSKIPQFANTSSKFVSPFAKSKSGQVLVPKFLKKYGPRRALSEVKPILGGVTDGVIGGLADYGLERATDQGFKTKYGEGAQSIHQPITLLDLASYGLLGGVLGAGRKYGTGRAYDDMRGKLGDPSKISNSEVDDFLKIADEVGKDTDALKNKWQWSAFADYNEKYPNSAKKVKRPPKPEISDESIDATKKLPLLSDDELKQEDTEIIENVLYKLTKNGDEDDLKEFGKELMMETMGQEVPYVANKIPLGYVKPTDEFMKRYIKQNEDYFDFVRKDNLIGKGHYHENVGLKDALKSYQESQSKWADLFDGGYEILLDDEYKINKNIVSGAKNKGGSQLFGQNQQEKDMLANNILGKKSELGTIDDEGNFKPATREQKEDFDRAMDKKNERKFITPFFRDDLEKQKRKYRKRYTKKAAIPFGISHLIYNHKPFSRSIGDVAPYEYISPINTEEEDK